MPNVKAYLIGDCQSNRVYEHYTGDGSMINLMLWGKGGKSAWHFDPIEMRKKEVVGDKLEHSNAVYTYEPFSFSLVEDSEENLIVAWFGYIDCKYKIAIHDDAEQTAYRYVNNLKKHFSRSKILLIEPLPQFVEDIYIESEKIPVFDYEVRRRIELEFCSALKMFAKDFGIENYITQEEILEAIGLNELTLNDTPDDRENRIDGLKPHHNLAIYNLIVQRSIKIIS
jgi:hypothetical protein